MTLNDETTSQDDWLQHPQVKALIERLAGLDKMVADFEAKVGPLAASIKKAEQDKDEFIQSIQEELKKHDRAIRELKIAKEEIDSEMRAAVQLKATVQGEINSTIEGLTAQANLEVLQSRWQDIMDSNEWTWVESIRPFQMTGAQFIASGIDRDMGGVLLADQMGLGKTLQAAAAIDLLQNHPQFEEFVLERHVNVEADSASLGAVLWLCPSGIKHSTRRELAKWTDRGVVILEGNPGIRGNIVNIAHQNGFVLIAGYEQVRDRGKECVTPEIMALDWPLIVMDEAHKFKNRDSSTFTNVDLLTDRAGYVIPMTGTPIMNRPDEFWAILHMLTKKGHLTGKFARYFDFENQYLSVWGTQAQFQPGAFDRLIKNVQDMVLRRRKDEVGIELPDKIREVRFVTLTGRQRELYDEMRDKLYVWLDEQKSDFVNVTNFLAQLTRLRQIALLPSGVKIKREDGTEMVLDCNESSKIEEAMAVIEECLDNEEKILIFSNYNEPLEEIIRRVAAMEATFNGAPVTCGKIIGGVPDRKRSEYMADFNDSQSPLRVLVGNIRAMGTGLNLQEACSHAIFLDLDWSPGSNEQAEDRLHRQGQSSNVIIHIIQAEDTVDAFIALKLEQKQGLIEGIIERSELRRALDEGLI